MRRVIVIYDIEGFNPTFAIDGMIVEGDEIHVIDLKTKETAMFNRRNILTLALSSFGAALASGVNHLTEVAVANSNLRSFAQRYGNNPRSLNGNSVRNSKAAQQKRAARKLRNIRAKSSKRA